MKLDGGGGGDKIRLLSDDSLIAITDSAISLNFSKIEIDYAKFSELNLIGGASDNKIEINGFHFDKFDFDGGGGINEINLNKALPAVQLTGDKISLLDDTDKLVGEIKYAGFDTFSYLGDETASKIELDDTIKFRELKLDGGGGGDKIRLLSDDSLIAITDSAISLNFSKIEIDYKEFTDFGLVADKTTPLALEIDGFKFTNMDVTAGAVGSSILEKLRLIAGIGDRDQAVVAEQSDLVAAAPPSSFNSRNFNFSCHRARSCWRSRRRDSLNVCGPGKISPTGGES